MDETTGDTREAWYEPIVERRSAEGSRIPSREEVSSDFLPSALQPLVMESSLAEGEPKKWHEILLPNQKGSRAHLTKFTCLMIFVIPLVVLAALGALIVVYTIPWAHLPGPAHRIIPRITGQPTRSPTPEPPSVHAVESAALRDLFYAMGGVAWPVLGTIWNNGTDYCAWNDGSEFTRRGECLYPSLPGGENLEPGKGVCCNKEGRVETIGLNIYNFPVPGGGSDHAPVLVGTLPTSIAHLKALRSLDLSGPPIPRVAKGNKRLSGTVPWRALAQLPLLERLSITDNHFRGVIPSKRGTLLMNIIDLELSNNFLSGSLSSGFFANMSRCVDLAIDRNGVSGTIPEEIRAMTELIGFDIHENIISGTLPNGLGACTDIKVIEGSGNRISGTLPGSYARLTALQALKIDDNHLSGTLPAVAWETANLRILDISHNSFTGTIPSQLGLLDRCSIFDVHTNALSGTIPQSFTALTALEFFDVSQNRMSGTIPEIRATALEEFTTSYNALVGLIPKSLGEMMPSLFTVELHNNRLSGTLPSALKATTNLAMIDLSNNFIEGELVDFGSPNVWYIDVHNNSISGTLPGLVACESLQLMNVAFNSISGSLPDTYALLTQLQEMYVGCESAKHHTHAPINQRRPCDLTS